MKKRKLNRLGWIVLGSALLVGVGCKDEVGEVSPPQAEHFTNVGEINLGHPPGLAVPAVPPTEVAAQVATLAAQTKFVPSQNPWALSQEEAEYDTRAQNEIVFSRANGGQFWPATFVPKVETITVEVVEPQPFRRLAGVLIGDSVMAIIDMGNGSPMQLIRPGMSIPNSPWKVKSIDQDKAVLIRGGNKLPREIIVRLQGPLAPGGGGVAQPTNPPPGNPGNPGNPGRPGGGRFGGGGGRGAAGGAID